MSDEIKRALTEAGMDTADVLDRLMGNERLLFRCMRKFLEDKNFEKLQHAIADEEKEAALAASHTLKGVCGNLSMKELFQLLTEQVQAFRADEWEQALGWMPQIAWHYERMVIALKGVMGDEAANETVS